MKKASISLKAFDPIIENFEKISKVQRILIYGGAFLVLIGLFVYFSYMPKFQKIRTLNSTYAKIEKELIVAKKKAQTLEKYRHEMKKAEAQFKIVKKALPEKKEIPSLLASISRSGQEAGLEFLSFEPKSEKMNDFYAEIPVAIKVKGNYHNVALFYDKVSKLPRIVNVRDISMGAGSKKAQTELSTSCTTVTYKFVEASPKKESKSKKKNSKRKKKR